ncbi:MAG: hypothetical protein EKK41_26065 [Hyphomicrobiales bacterium]|nr:MAG: hypothetical protein EKK41_26065 [Hyphomicrobiales bacterium]
MEFRLTYEGALKGASKTNTRAKHKHELRRVFHAQLKRWWDANPYLRNAFHSHPFTGRTRPEKLLWVHLSEQWERLGYNFVPLVTEELSLICGIEVLILRPSVHGVLMNSGDIDARLKTLFDALRMPSNKEELGGNTSPLEDERPFFVLLQDDKLISHVSVTTDTLLQPTNPDAGENSARVVIHVKLRPYNQGWHNINFG